MLTVCLVDWYGFGVCLIVYVVCGWFWCVLYWVLFVLDCSFLISLIVLVAWFVLYVIWLCFVCIEFLLLCFWLIVDLCICVSVTFVFNIDCIFWLIYLLELLIDLFCFCLWVIVYFPSVVRFAWKLCLFAYDLDVVYWLWLLSFLLGLFDLFCLVLGFGLVVYVGLLIKCMFDALNCLCLSMSWLWVGYCMCRIVWFVFDCVSSLLMICLFVIYTLMLL